MSIPMRARIFAVPNHDQRLETLLHGMDRWPERYASEPSPMQWCFVHIVCRINVRTSQEA